MEICNSCPRNCTVQRPFGFCRAPTEFLVSRVALHPFEEPVISGRNGSGTIFFGGCNLKCVYCQNKEISRGGKGRILSPRQLEEEILSLCEKGAHNINFVTPTHYAPGLAALLEKIKHRIPVPIVYNCGGYEDTDALSALCGLVDVYMPDLKYFSSELSEKYSGAANYFSVAIKAIEEMHRQCPKLIYGDDGTLKNGLIVRHLVLPSHRRDSVVVLENLEKTVPVKDMLLSLMSQYTPHFCDGEKYPELNRKITSFEYDFVAKRAVELGFEGFFQHRSSAVKDYTPEF